MKQFYVVQVDVYGASREVVGFDTKKEALDYMESLPEDIYMVILRNDAESFKQRKNIV